jgi:hypothetical protein
VRGHSTSDYVLAHVVFLVAWLVLSSPWTLGTVTIPYDAKAHFQAQIQFLANAIHTGQSPFWTPHIFVGLPQIADPQSLIFSPAYLLAYFDAVPSFRTLDIYVFALLAAAGVAIVEMFRGRGWHPAGAVLAAIAIAFGSSAAWRIQHIGQIQSYAFFCIAIWLLDRLLRQPTRWSGVWAGLAFGALLAEANQVSLLGAYILAGVVVGHWLAASSPRCAIKQSFPALCIAAVTMTLIAGVPVVMTALFVLSSNRPSIPLAEAARGSLHPISLLTAVVGDLFGALDPKVDYWGPFSEHWNPKELTLSQNMSQLYLGALPVLLLITVGLSRGLAWAVEIRAYSIAAIVMLLYAVGTHTPLFEIFHRLIPGVAMFRRPADATFLLGAMMAIVAGYVAHRWLILVTGVFAIAVMVALHEQKLELAQKPILQAAAWVLASVVVFRSMRLAAIGRPAIAIVATASLMTLDLRFNNGPNESTAGLAEDYEVLDPKCRYDTIRFLKEKMRRAPGSEWRDRVELVGLGFEWPNSAMVHGLEHTLGYNPVRIDAVSTVIGAGDHIAGPSQRGFSPLFPSYRSTMANMLGLRFIASSVPIEQVDTTLPRGALKFVARTKRAFIYENTSVLPRVLVASHAIRADFSEMTRSGVWPTFDPRMTVLFDRADTAFWAAHMDDSGHDTAVASARIAKYENTRVEVDVVSPHRAALVLHDVWHPWWRATVDDQPTPILKANVLFRAVTIPAGHHKVVFEFHPFSGALAELQDKAFNGR